MSKPTPYASLLRQLDDMDNLDMDAAFSGNNNSNSRLMGGNPGYGAAGGGNEYGRNMAAPAMGRSQSPVNNFSTSASRPTDDYKMPSYQAPDSESFAPEARLERNVSNSEASAEVSRSLAQQYREMFNAASTPHQQPPQRQQPQPPSRQMYNAAPPPQAEEADEYDDTYDDTSDMVNAGIRPSLANARAVDVSMLSLGSALGTSYDDDKMKGSYMNQESPMVNEYRDFMNGVEREPDRGVGRNHSSGARPNPYGAPHSRAAPAPIPRTREPPMTMPVPRSNTTDNPLVKEYRALVKGIEEPMPADDPPPDRGAQNAYGRAASPFSARGRVRDIRSELEANNNNNNHGGAYGAQGTGSMPLATGMSAHAMSAQYDRNAQGSRGRALPTSRFDRAASPHGARGRVRDIRSELENNNTGAQGTVPMQTRAAVGQYDRNAQGSRGRALPTNRFDRAASPHAARGRVQDIRNEYESNNNTNPSNTGTMPLGPSSPRGTTNTYDRNAQGSRGRALPTSRFDRAASPHAARGRVMDMRNDTSQGGAVPSEPPTVPTAQVTPVSRANGSRGRALPKTREDRSQSPHAARGRIKEKRTEKEKRSKTGRSKSPGALAMLRGMAGGKRSGRDKKGSKDEEDASESHNDQETAPTESSVKKSSSWGALKGLGKKSHRSKKKEEGSANAEFPTVAPTSPTADGETKSSMKKSSSWGALKKMGKKTPRSKKAEELRNSKYDPVADILNPSRSNESGGSRNRDPNNVLNAANIRQITNTRPQRTHAPTRHTSNQSAHVGVTRGLQRTGSGKSQQSSATAPSFAAVQQTRGSGRSPLRPTNSGPMAPVRRSPSSPLRPTNSGPLAPARRMPSAPAISPHVGSSSGSHPPGRQPASSSLNKSNPQSMIEISPGVKLPLIDYETTKRAYERQMISEQTCMGCQTVINCADVADYVICPACEVVSPTQSQGRRRVKVSGGSKVALGFVGGLK